MREMTILGLLVVLVVGIGTVSVFADTIMTSPLQQWKQGVPLEEILCNDDKIPIETNSGKPACVTEIMSEKMVQRGWQIVESVKPAMGGDLIRYNDPEFRTHTYTVNEPFGKGHSSIGFVGSPISSLQIPNTISVGQTVHINYTISWFYPNGTSILDGIVDVNDRDDMVFSRVGILLPDEFTILNEDKEFFRMYGDEFTTHTATWYEFVHPYNIDVISDSIKVRLDKPMMYDLDIFYGSIGHNSAYLITDKTDSGVILRERDYFTEPTDLNTLYAISLGGGGGEENGRYDVPYFDDVPHVPSEKEQVSRTSSASNTDMYMEEDFWDDFAEFLRTVRDRENVTDFRTWLTDDGMSDDFINDFFAEYPEFAKTETGLAVGSASPPPQIFVYGNYYLDSDATKPAIDVQICAFDQNLSNRTSQVLFNGNAKVCV